LLISIFSCPKGFEGHFDVIQRNAINSWLSLKPKPEILLFGDELGTAEVCREYALRHVSGIECNEFGTPLINAIFGLAQDTASSDILCYVNTDIILLQDFLMAILRIEKELKFYLLVGQRWDIDCTDPLDFTGEVEKELRKRVMDQLERLSISE